MARASARAASPASGGATLDFRQQLWAMADGLRGRVYEQFLRGLMDGRGALPGVAQSAR